MVVDDAIKQLELMQNELILPNYETIELAIKALKLKKWFDGEVLIRKKDAMEALEYKDAETHLQKIKKVQPSIED